jgi:DNA-binding transcriptional LysR family regulator
VELHHVRYFLAVVDHQGVNAAAVALQVSQPTVSHGIRDLERTLGTELFHRLGRGVALTSAGHALIGPARRVYRDVVAAEGLLPDAAGQLRGRLDIAAAASLSSDPLARLISAFRRQHPRVFVRIGNVDAGEDGPALVRHGDYEIVLCYPPVIGAVDLRVDDLGVQEYCIAFPPGTELPGQDPLPLSALPDLPLVAVHRGDERASEIEHAIAAAGVPRRLAVLVDNPQARLPFVLAGVGGSFLPRAVAESARGHGLVLRRTDPPISWEYGVLYDDSALSPAARAFVAIAHSLRADLNACNSQKGARGR